VEFQVLPPLNLAGMLAARLFIPALCAAYLMDRA
jgi:hypothetical protein